MESQEKSEQETVLGKHIPFFKKFDLLKREKSIIRREANIAECEQKMLDAYQVLETKKASLNEREKAIIVAEQRRDTGFADERTALNQELRDKRAQVEMEISNIREKKLAELEDEIVKLRDKRLSMVSEAENVERDRIRGEIARERNAWIKQQDDAQKQLNIERTEVEKQKGALSAMQSEIEGRTAELEDAERVLERKEQRLEQLFERRELRLQQQSEKRNDQLDDERDSQIEEYRNSFESRKQLLIKEKQTLQESLACQTELLGAFEHLKRQLGGKDPAEIIRDLNSQTDELKRLHEELATRPTEEMREQFQTLESKFHTEKRRADMLEQQISANEAAIAEVSNLRRENSELNAENKSLAQKASRFEGAANEASAELNRLRAAYERPAEVEARYKEIELAHITMVNQTTLPDKADLTEVEWLKEIGKECDKYGLHFNLRILKAFHTALKTSEWSPLTILAGVSGTGKSELPRLYSHFGGIYFAPLSVQPNWDSQESMLGFFNSIDNKFDAQPVLRFLAQSQKARSDEYPGLSEAMCLVLLDEMNLAHPELYFAEFLSKLELRRGIKGSDVPFLPVKIGAGLPPYELPLGRNVLWVGTMNQDETTKSLSDKVLDRSTIITFPRPTELKRRVKLTPLDDNNLGPALPRKLWNSWLAQESSFDDEKVKPFKEFIEKINTALAVTGRALGHRAWQSIEYYMVNYPDVHAAQESVKVAKDQSVADTPSADKDTSSPDDKALDKAMHRAFEDQLVQKVMPKLRGLDTRGKSNECLDDIREQLATGINGKGFNLIEDFDLACELGYGQFIWQSANYLKDESE